MTEDRIMTRKNVRRSFAALVLFVTTFSSLAQANSSSFRRGDFNQDDQFDIADPVKLLDFLFLSGGDPRCLDAGDINDDSAVDIADSLYGLGYLFLGGPAPSAPFAECGQDPTDDSLTCEAFRTCRVPNLSERIGHCGGVPGGQYPNSLQPGDDLQRVTLDAPLAVCNDGTPAVYYVRPAAPDSPHADNWVIYLQGGGGCRSFEDCVARWCGRQGGPYNEAKMSSLYCPDSIGGTGMFRRDGFPNPDAENAFGDFNQVFVYYCSSDSWSGRASNAVLTSEEDPSRQYSLHFQGHNIVRATVASLMEGGVVSDNQRLSMPSLEDAEFVLISGFSAGSGGVTTNGDWMASQLERNGTVVRLIKDASFNPRTEVHPDPAKRLVIAGHQRARTINEWETRSGPNGFLNAFVDESARAALEGTADEWKMVDKTYVFHNHITTPTFVRVDLLDRGTAATYAEWGISAQEFANMMAVTLREIPLVKDRGIEGDAITQRGGAFGPMCHEHVGLMSDTSFFAKTVDTVTGQARTYHDTLVHWLEGNAITVVDDPKDRSTVCGASEEELE